MDGLAAAPLAQVLIDEVVIGILGRKERWLDALLAAPELLNKVGLGMTPLFAACYALWPQGVRQLLAAGADPRGALEAVRLGVKDWEGSHNGAAVRHTEIMEILLSHGRVRSCWRPSFVAVAEVTSLAA